MTKIVSAKIQKKSGKASKKSFKQTLQDFDKNKNKNQNKINKNLKDPSKKPNKYSKVKNGSNNVTGSTAVSVPSSSATSAPSSSLIQGSSSKLSSLQHQFLKKLEGARFRTINEELYTTRGDVAFQEFQRDPSKFEIYHKGYRDQAALWPVNPLDSIIQWIISCHKKATIADMGCGDARLAASVPNKVHSFDLVAVNTTVTPCDIAHVPLATGSVDIVIFCLSLMGVNMPDFIKEALRILKINGILKVAEVRSRFGDNKGILAFNKFLQRAGFEVKAHDRMAQNKMFFEVECVKMTDEGIVDDTFELKPCQYKKR